MTDGPPPSNPPRLSAEGGEASRLLRSAETEFRLGLDESAAYERTERALRRRRAVTWGVGAASAAAVVLAITNGAGRIGRAPAEIALTPEPLPSPPAPVLVELSPKSEAAPPTDTPPRRETPENRTPTAAVPTLVRVPAPIAEERIADAPETVSEADCRGLARAGETERAIGCFRVLARGSGVGAEVASYEAARLSANALGDAARALTLLDAHRERFPGGALRGEVAWLRVQSLRGAGRVEEALVESEALLGTPAGRALSADIHWLRARIHEEDRNDCQSAVIALVALIGEPGPRGDEAEMRRAGCLERLGRSAEALAAYERYLRRPEPRREADARARIQALTP